ncbi:peptidoglycan recognition protein family protein [Yinghuangia sp. YIM S09857]|uniref:peptidoglycan recognition protein family protein n=1 Tax=Yinghuangia sp. YIM S09857 TaxID=3436929 RepID=UPI003F531879
MTPQSARVPVSRLLKVSALLAAVVLTPVLSLPTHAVAAQETPVPVSGASYTVALPGLPGADVRSPGPGQPAVLVPARSTHDFSLVGVSWDDPSARPDFEVSVRTRTAGAWTPWRPLHTGDAMGQYADAPRPAAARGATEPLWVGRSDAVQARVEVRSGRLPGGLRLDLVDPGTSPADARMTGRATDAAPGRAAGRPAIVTRGEWGADETLRDLDVKYTNTVKVMFVHHDNNTYATCADSPSVLRSIYRYHVETNGWADIGYNFLVDRCGTVFEGRAGGVDKPVLGAHTLGFNTNSSSVAAMGTYTDTAPPDALLDSMSRVIAWKLGLHGADPLGKAQLTSGDSGSRFPAGTNVRFNVVSGHRDAFNTECPGERLYEALPKLRRGVESLMR